MVLMALRLGCPMVTAAAIAKIDQNTVYRWINDEPAFGIVAREAEAAAIAEGVGRIRRAAEGGYVFKVTTTTLTRRDGAVEERVAEERALPQWTADSWLLERRWPQHFGRRDTVTLQLGQVIEETRRLAEQAGVDPDLAVEEAKRLLDAPP